MRQKGVWETGAIQPGESKPLSEFVAANVVDITGSRVEMAKPRVFVSSTYYDLRVIRADLERFMRELGYEPVLFERGHIPYGKEEALEEYCYREISSCDMVVSIIGGKYGSQSKDQKSSITQRELRVAIEQGKQIYIFIEKAVLGEYRTYLGNRDVPGFKPTAVNDSRVYSFIEELYGLPSGNPIEGFEISDDIVRYLREQWAGLFQRLLHESAQKNEVNIIESLKSTASTLNHLVTFLTEERSKGDQAIKDILLSTHPAFGAVKAAAKIPYRIIFYTLDELEALVSARSFKRDEAPFDDDYYEWDNHKLGLGIRISKEVFDPDGRLKVFTPDEWDDTWVSSYRLQAPSDDRSDDIPF